MLSNRLNISLLELLVLLFAIGVHAAPNPAPVGQICRPPQFSCGDGCCLSASYNCVNDVCIKPPPPPPCKVPCGAKCCFRGTDPKFPDFGGQYCADASRSLCCEDGKASCNGNCCNWGLVCRSFNVLGQNILACLHPIYTKEQCRAKAKDDPCQSDSTCPNGFCSSGCCVVNPR